MIPEIDVRRCVAAKEYEGTLSFSFEADASLLEIPFVKFAAPVEARLGWFICRDNETVELSGEVSFTLCGACSRCLAEAEQPFTYRAEAVFVRGESDGEEYGYLNGKIKLEEFLRDSILFALPQRLLCKACGEWEKD